jgi:hypothetical protein
MSQDLRRYARQTTFRLVIGFLLILFVVGEGLIYIFYGPGAALMGLACLIAGLLPLIFIWLGLWVIGVIVERANNR